MKNVKEKIGERSLSHTCLNKTLVLAGPSSLIMMCVCVFVEWWLHVVWSTDKLAARIKSERFLKYSRGYFASLGCLRIRMRRRYWPMDPGTKIGGNFRL